MCVFNNKKLTLKKAKKEFLMRKDVLVLEKLSAPVNCKDEAEEIIQ